MKNFLWRFALIGGLTLAGFLAMWPPSQKLKLGIDLSGGTILVYEVDTANLPPGFNMDELVSALKNAPTRKGSRKSRSARSASTGSRSSCRRPATRRSRTSRRCSSTSGALEFRILANRKHDEDAIPRALGPAGLAKPPSRYKWARLGEISTGTNPTTTGESLTDTQQTWKKDQYAGTDVFLTGKDSLGNEATDSVRIKRNSVNTLYLEKPHKLKSIASYRVEYNPSRIRGGDPNRPDPSDVIIREEKVAPGRTETWILYNLDRPGQEVTGKYLRQVRPEFDDKLQPAVRFEFDRAGARRFGKLTREHLPEEDAKFKFQLAILLDNLVMSAPVINSEIRDSGIIEGGPQGFKAKEVEHLVNVLRAGSLPASLNPTPLQEEKVGPTLGEDTIAKGIRAIWVSMLVVPIFMLVYYRFAGVVATIALVVNMILLIGSMAFMQATFSLPGLAGLALTIGMAVDANVLVFERMREEKERGASLAQQIRNGFNRAWITIFDSHVTNFLAAVVLYLVGTEEVKGFALTMMIGMAWNLFTAVFMSRVIFEYCYSKGWLKDVTMLKMMGKTNFDFIGPAILLHGRLADPDRPGADRHLLPRQLDVQHRLHRRHAGHDPAQ